MVMLYLSFSLKIELIYMKNILFDYSHDFFNKEILDMTAILNKRLSVEFIRIV